MRRIAWLAALITVAGCATAKKPDGATLADLAALEEKFSEKNNQIFVLHQELTNRMLALDQKIMKLENLTEAFRIEIAKLNEKLAGLAAAPAPSNPTPDPAPPRTDPSVSIEQALQVTEAQLLRLKQGMRQEDVVQALLPIARFAVPKVCEALKTSLRDIEYMRRLEYVLSKMPVDDLKIPIEESLKDTAARYAAVRVIGEVGDRNLSALLEPLTSTDDLEFSYSLGYSLVRCKNRAGVPALIRALRSGDKYIRGLSISTLRGLNKGDSIGYDSAKDAEANAPAIKAWEDWYEKEGPKLFQ